MGVASTDMTQAGSVVDHLPVSTKVTLQASTLACRYSAFSLSVLRAIDAASLRACHCVPAPRLLALDVAVLLISLVFSLPLSQNIATGEEIHRRAPADKDIAFQHTQSHPNARMNAAALDVEGVAGRAMLADPDAREALLNAAQTHSAEYVNALRHNLQSGMSIDDAKRDAAARTKS